jgi:hypothetical protein
MPDLEKLPYGFQFALQRLNQLATRRVYGPNGDGTRLDGKTAPEELPEWHCTIIGGPTCNFCGTTHSWFHYKGHGATANEAITQAFEELEKFPHV